MYHANIKPIRPTIQSECIVYSTPLTFLLLQVQPSSTYWHRSRPNGPRLLRHGCKDAHSPAAFFSFTWQRTSSPPPKQASPAAVRKRQASWHLPIIISSFSLLIGITAAAFVAVTRKRYASRQQLIVV